MRSAEITIIGGEDDQCFVLHASIFNGLTNHANSYVYGVDKLVVLRHNFVVRVVVVPLFKPLVLSPLP